MPETPDRFARVRAIVEDPITVGVLWLVHNGIPFDLAENLTAEELEGWGIVFGQFHGGEFNFDQWKWKDPR